MLETPRSLLLVALLLPLTTVACDDGDAPTKDSPADKGADGDVSAGDKGVKIKAGGTEVEAGDSDGTAGVKVKTGDSEVTVGASDGDCKPGTPCMRKRLLKLPSLSFFSEPPAPAPLCSPLPTTVGCRRRQLAQARTSRRGLDLRER